MKRVAVLVDAGYLFAQGSIALTGIRQPRSLMVLDGPTVVSRLAEFAATKAACEFLRVYWYDGASFKGPTIEQDNIAHLDNVKLRLGLLNSAGEQKGVDSLIVTDLIELARLGAICDAAVRRRRRPRRGADRPELRRQGPPARDRSVPRVPVEGSSARGRHHDRVGPIGRRDIPVSTAGYPDSDHPGTGIRSCRGDGHDRKHVRAGPAFRSARERVG